MPEHRFTHHLMVLHPIEARALMLKGENGWQLPSFSPEKGFFPLAEEINHFMQTTLTLEGVVLRPAHRCNTENQTNTLYLCEAHTLPKNSCGQWLEAEQLDAVFLERQDHKPFLLTALAEDKGLKAIPEERPTWARRGWWKDAEDWLQDELGRLGYHEVSKFEQLRQWSISTVGRVQTEKGTLYFKAAPPMFAREAEITVTLAQLFPSNLPQVITSHPEKGWFVMADFGDHKPDNKAAYRAAALRRLADMQIEVVNHQATLMAGGCEERPLAALTEAFDELLEYPRVKAELTSEDLELLDTSRPKIQAMLAELANCGVPETLSHGDFHFGNVAVKDDNYIIFDWTDACITHPYIDIAHATSYYDEPEKQALIAAYLEPWRRAFPNAQIERAFTLAEVAMPIFLLKPIGRFLPLSSQVRSGGLKVQWRII